MSPTLMLLTCARPAVQWTRTRLGSSHWLDRTFARLESALGIVTTCRVPVPVPIPYPRRTPRVAGLAVLALALMAFAPPPASAQDYRNDGAWRTSDRGNGWNEVADGQLVDVRVLVDGRTSPLYFAPRRLDRQYFEAFRGRNYAIEVRNNTGRRVGVLMAVDGLNVVSGERSALSNHESMYVLDPYESTVIRGWRTSLRDVRKFVFVDEQRSYAERTGQANGDMGWIRVLAFRENAPRGGWFRDEESDPRMRGFEGAPNAPQSKAQRGNESESRMRADGGQSNPGTGWGEQGYDPVHRTRFEAEARATDHLVLRYEYASGLRALGIRPWNGRDRLWDRERGDLGFAQPPRW